ncbi:MAG: DUF624 domain-containing protein [Lachnospira sp.]
MNGFGLDGKLFRGLTKAGDFIILGFLTVVFCIPVVTIGGALTAAFYSAVKLVKDEESYVFKDFMKSFKMNFRQGLFVELILAFLGIFLFLDLRAAAYWAFAQGSAVGMIFMYAILGVMLVWAAVLLYSFAMLSRYDNNALVTIKNSLIMCVHHLPQTVIMMIATYGFIYFSIQYWTAFIVTIPLILYVDGFVFSKIFKNLEKDIAERKSETESIEASEEKAETESIEVSDEKEETEEQ